MKGIKECRKTLFRTTASVVITGVVGSQDNFPANWITFSIQRITAYPRGMDPQPLFLCGKLGCSITKLKKLVFTNVVGAFFLPGTSPKQK
jgi:hypothetical protein